MPKRNAAITEVERKIMKAKSKSISDSPKTQKKKKKIIVKLPTKKKKTKTALFNKNLAQEVKIQLANEAPNQDTSQPTEPAKGEKKKLIIRIKEGVRGRPPKKRVPTKKDSFNTNNGTDIAPSLITCTETAHLDNSEIIQEPRTSEAEPRKKRSYKKRKLTNNVKTGDSDNVEAEPRKKRAYRKKNVFNVLITKSATTSPETIMCTTDIKVSSDMEEEARKDNGQQETCAVFPEPRKSGSFSKKCPVATDKSVSESSSFEVNRTGAEVQQKSRVNRKRRVTKDTAPSNLNNTQLDGSSQAPIEVTPTPPRKRLYRKKVERNTQPTAVEESTPQPKENTPEPFLNLADLSVMSRMPVDPNKTDLNVIQDILKEVKVPKKKIRRPKQVPSSETKLQTSENYLKGKPNKKPTDTKINNLTPMLDVTLEADLNNSDKTKDASLPSKTCDQPLCSPISRGLRSGSPNKSCNIKLNSRTESPNTPTSVNWSRTSTNGSKVSLNNVKHVENVCIDGLVPKILVIDYKKEAERNERKSLSRSSTLSNLTVDSLSSSLREGAKTIEKPISRSSSTVSCLNKYIVNRKVLSPAKCEPPGSVLYNDLELSSMSSSSSCTRTSSATSSRSRSTISTSKKTSSLTRSEIGNSSSSTEIASEFSSRLKLRRSKSSTSSASDLLTESRPLILSYDSVLSAASTDSIPTRISGCETSQSIKSSTSFKLNKSVRANSLVCNISLKQLTQAGNDSPIKPTVLRNQSPKQTTVSCTQSPIHKSLPCNQSPKQPQVLCNQSQEPPLVHYNQPSKQLTVPYNQLSKQPTVPYNQLSKQPTVPYNQLSKQPTVPYNQLSKQPTVPYNQSSKQPTIPSKQSPEKLRVSCNQSPKQPTAFCYQSPRDLKSACIQSPRDPRSVHSQSSNNLMLLCNQSQKPKPFSLNEKLQNILDIQLELSDDEIDPVDDEEKTDMPCPEKDILTICSSFKVKPEPSNNETGQSNEDTMEQKTVEYITLEDIKQINPENNDRGNNLCNVKIEPSDSKADTQLSTDLSNSCDDDGACSDNDDVLSLYAESLGELDQNSDSPIHNMFDTNEREAPALSKFGTPIITPTDKHNHFRPVSPKQTPHIDHIKNEKTKSICEKQRADSTSVVMIENKTAATDTDSKSNYNTHNKHRNSTHTQNIQRNNVNTISSLNDTLETSFNNHFATLANQYYTSNLDTTHNILPHATPMPTSQLLACYNRSLRPLDMTKVYGRFKHNLKFWRNVCLFFLNGGCVKGENCRYEHRDVHNVELECWLKYVTDAVLAQEYVRIRKLPIRLKYIKSFVSEAISRNLPRIVIEMLYDLTSKKKLNNTPHIINEVTEIILLYFNNQTLDTCYDFLVYGEKGNTLCEYMLKFIITSQNFSRYKDIFVKLTYLIMNTFQTFDAQNTIQFLERISLLPFDGKVAKALVQMIIHSDASVMQHESIDMFEKLISRDESIYNEYIEFKGKVLGLNSAIPNPATSTFDAATLKGNTNTSPDTTNNDVMKNSSTIPNLSPVTPPILSTAEMLKSCDSSQQHPPQCQTDFKIPSAPSQLRLQTTTRPYRPNYRNLPNNHYQPRMPRPQFRPHFSRGSHHQFGATNPIIHRGPRPGT